MRRKINDFNYTVIIVLVIAALLWGMGESNLNDTTVRHNESARESTGQVSGINGSQTGGGAGCGAPNCSSSSGNSSIGNYSSGIGPDPACVNNCWNPPPLGVPIYNPNATVNGTGISSHSLTSAHIRPSTFKGHYWLGAAFAYWTCDGGIPCTTQTVWTSIGTPSSDPKAGDFYYELLSVYDSNGNYDQIGIDSNASAHSSWGVTIANCNCDCSHGFYKTDVVALNPYSTYSFKMLLTGTNIQFELYDGVGVSGSPIWTYQRSDSAGWFDIEQINTCDGTNYNDFTVYEEVYYISTTQNFPQWDFEFADTSWGSNTVTTGDWGTFTQAASGTSVPTSPHGYYVDLSQGGGAVRVANEAIWSALFNFYIIAPGQGFTDNGNEVQIGAYCSGGSNCPTSISCSVPSGWTGGGYLGGSTSPTTLTYSTTSPAGAISQPYYSGCLSTITSTSPQEWTTFIFYIYVT